MDDYVARLVRCGLSRRTAICICNHFKRRNKLPFLARYVALTEYQHECVV